MLTDEQKQRRQGKIGASFIPKLMAGDEAAIANEWMRLVDHPGYVEVDLSNEWLPSFGAFIEPFVLNWHERQTGMPLTDRGQWVDHPHIPYLGCTLDAFRVADNTVIDAKAPSRWNSLENVLATYPGQLVVQKSCTNADNAALLVCHGGDEPTEHAVIWEAEYEAEVWRRIQWFWERVETLQAPCKLPGIKAKLIDAVRVVDFTGNNAWADFAATWLATKAAKTKFDEAAKGIKTLIEDDVARAFGHGICATRSKAGAITVKAA